MYLFEKGWWCSVLFKLFSKFWILTSLCYSLADDELLEFFGKRKQDFRLIKIAIKDGKFFSYSFSCWFSYQFYINLPFIAHMILFVQNELAYHLSSSVVEFELNRYLFCIFLVEMRVLCVLEEILYIV